MKVSKWGNSLAIRIPKDVARALGLEEGDEVQVTATDDAKIAIARSERVSKSIERMRRLARPLPADWKFDRDEVSSR